MGKCYKAMRVMDIYLRLDEYIKRSVETYLENLGVRLVGKNKRKHMKLLGIPSLTAMVEYKRKSPPEVCSVSASSMEGQSWRLSETTPVAKV